MKHGDIVVKVRGIKYKLEYSDQGTTATTKFGVSKLISPAKVEGDLAADRIKFTWHLKPYRELGQRTEREKALAGRYYLPGKVSGKVIKQGKTEKLK